MRSVFRLMAAALLTAACSSQTGEQAASPTTGEAAGRPDWNDVSLELTLEAIDDPNRNRPHFRSSLSNRGAGEVVVVLPGDGSPLGWRTPIVEWIVEAADGERVEPRTLARCGNINPLKRDEVVNLAPGESVSLDRYGMGYPHVPTQGTFHVSLRYVNDPGLDWSGIPLGPHEAGAMERLRASTPCTVISNRIRVERP